MKKITILMHCILIYSCNTINNKNTANNCDFYWDNRLKNKVFIKVDSSPYYKNGDPIEFLEDFTKEFRYPTQNDIQTKIVMEFIIDKKGKLLFPCIYQKKVNEYTEVDKEGLRALSTMNIWVPGFCNGKKANTKLIRSIRLELRK